MADNLLFSHFKLCEWDICTLQSVLKWKGKSNIYAKSYLHDIWLFQLDMNQYGKIRNEIIAWEVHDFVIKMISIFKIYIYKWINIFYFNLKFEAGEWRDYWNKNGIIVNREDVGRDCHRNQRWTLCLLLLHSSFWCFPDANLFRII